MAEDLPQYYFRIRENGAAVFRVVNEPRNRRLDLEQIATVNLRNGEIKPQGEGRLTPQDRAEIEHWRAARLDLNAQRDMDDILRSVDHLNLTTQWAQAKASPAQLEAVTDALLLAMHDLRGVLVRKKAERLQAAGGTQEDD